MLKRKNCFVKLSGDLFQKPAVVRWLRCLSRHYFVVISVGGGTQINLAFRRAGFPVRKHGPLGRETRTLKERQLQRNMLERNQATLQDILATERISAVVEIPWAVRGTVDCPVNGDTDVLVAYLGFHVLFVVTTRDRVAAKKRQFAPYPKVHIKGFHA